jgi:hypothetical protein
MVTVNQLLRDNLKHSKDEVRYEHNRGSRQMKCGRCIHFEQQGPNLCEIVDGRILPDDWCMKFNPNYLVFQ